MSFGGSGQDWQQFFANHPEVKVPEALKEALEKNGGTARVSLDGNGNVTMLDASSGSRVGVGDGGSVDNSVKRSAGYDANNPMAAREGARQAVGLAANWLAHRAAESGGHVSPEDVRAAEIMVAEIAAKGHGVELGGSVDASEDNSHGWRVGVGTDKAIKALRKFLGSEGGKILSKSPVGRAANAALSVFDADYARSSMDVTRGGVRATTSGYSAVIDKNAGDIAKGINAAYANGGGDGEKSARKVADMWLESSFKQFDHMAQQAVAKADKSMDERGEEVFGKPGEKPEAKKAVDIDWEHFH